MIRRAVAVAAMAALLAAPMPALGFFERSKDDLSIDLTGTVRLNGAWFHFADVPGLLPEDDEGSGAAVTRLMAEGTLAEDLGYEVNIFMDLSRAPAGALTAGAFSTARSFRSPYRAPGLSWDFWESGTVGATLGLDRFSFTREDGQIFLTVGRFPVNYTVMGAMAPNDFFAPFSAAAINRLYKAGVDAISFGVNVGWLSSLELVGVMGYASEDGFPSWGNSAFLFRGSTVLGGFEWAALGGKVAGRWIVGGSFQGEAGPFGVRGEGHVGFPDADGDGLTDRKPYGRFSVGGEALIPWQTISIAVEYAFFSDGINGGGVGYLERAARLFPDDMAFLGKHYAVLSVGGQIIPIVGFGTAVIVNASDGSGLVTLSVRYDVADEATFSAGALLPWGRKPETALELDRVTELGLAPVAIFVETQVYF